MANEISCDEYMKRYNANKWETLRMSAKMISDKLPMEKICAALADVACELAQYSIRKATGGTEYKEGSCADLLKYTAMCELWEMILVEKLDENKKNLFKTLEEDEAYTMHCKYAK